MAWLVHNDGDRITENVARNNAERRQYANCPENDRLYYDNCKQESGAVKRIPFYFYSCEICLYIFDGSHTTSY